MTTIAFLGLGHMGGPMAANLVAAGHTVRGFDPVAALTEAAADKGAQVFDSGAQAVVRSRRGHHLAAQRRHREGGLRRGAARGAKGTLFIDTSTISVDDARAIHAQAAEQGHAQLDAPVSGGVKGATAGTLAFMVGGEADAVERARPVLEPLAGKIIHCGASGTGRPPSCATTWCWPCSRSPQAKPSCWPRSSGLSAQSLFDVITGATGNCWAVHTNCPVPGPVPTSPANNEFKPGFATALMNKDIGLAMDAVKSTGSTAPLGSHAAEIYAKFAADHADKDFSAVIEMLRKA